MLLQSVRSTLRTNLSVERGYRGVVGWGKWISKQSCRLLSAPCPTDFCSLTEMEGVSRMDQLIWVKALVRSQLPPTVQHLAVEWGFMRRQRFVTGATRLKLDVISKLRCDANLRYLYTGVQKTRGNQKAPASMTAKLTSQELTRLTWVETVQPKVDLYTQRVCTSR